MDPRHLVQSCRYVKKSQSYECILNLQQKKGDGPAILGESAIRNTYTVFDVRSQKIGFAPAKSNYNQNFFQKFLKKIEDKIISEEYFVLRFYLTVACLFAIFLLFRYNEKLRLLVNLVLRKEVFKEDE